MTQEARDPNLAIESNEPKPRTDFHGLDGSFGQQSETSALSRFYLDVR